MVEKFYTVTDIMNKISYTRGTVVKKCQEGLYPYYKSQGKYLFDELMLEYIFKRDKIHPVRRGRSKHHGRAVDTNQITGKEIRQEEIKTVVPEVSEKGDMVVD